MIDKMKKKKKYDEMSISLKNDYICIELGGKSWLGKEGILSPKLWNSPNLTEDED